MKRALGVTVFVAICIAIWWSQRESAVISPPSMPGLTTGVAAARPTPPRVIPPPALQLDKPAAIRPSPKRTAPGAVDGIVIDAQTEEAVAGAELTFSHDDGAYSTVTGTGGGFHFAPREPGTYRLISIEAKGYVPFERDFGRSPVSFRSWPGYDVGGVVIRLSRTRHRRQMASDDDETDGGLAPKGALFGRVYDARSGAPAAAFAIALWRRDGLQRDVVAPASFIDPSGQYEIDGLEPGTYEVSALAPGYARSTCTTVDVGDTRAEADFALHSGARVIGTVTDASTRRPLAEVSVGVEGRRGASPNLPVAPLAPEDETGADGRFTLDHVPPDVIGLVAEKGGYLVRFVSLGDLPIDGDVTANIELTPKTGEAKIELTGIGAMLRVDGDGLFIRQVVPNAGAFDAGLAAGDQVLTIDGAPVTALDSAIASIRGPEGTIVRLRIRRGGRELDVPVVRKLVRN